MTDSRRKGADGERELRDALNALGFDTWRDAQQRGGDAGRHPDVAGIPGLHIECKRCERLNLGAAMEQSARDARDGEVPVVMHRRNREGWKATMRLEDFAAMWNRRSE